MGVGERLANFLKKTPRIGDSVFIAPSASVIGDVTLEDNVSIWYQAVLRGDINSIRIGYGTNLQDGVIGHLSDDYPLIVGEYVTVGHGAVLHACEIEDECLIGMNSTILDGSRIGKHSIVSLQKRQRPFFYNGPCKYGEISTNMGAVNERGTKYDSGDTMISSYICNDFFCLPF